MVSLNAIRYLGSLEPPVRIQGRLLEILNDGEGEYVVGVRRVFNFFKVKTDTGHIEYVSSV